MAQWWHRIIVAIGFALLVLVALRVMMPARAMDWSHLRTGFLLLALCIAIVQELLSPLTARAALRAIGSDGKLLPLLAIVTMAATANSVVPGPTGVPLRVWLQVRLLGVTPTQSTAASVLEALVGYGLLVAVALICTMLWLPLPALDMADLDMRHWRNTSLFLLATALVVVLALVLARRKLPALRQRLILAWRSFKLYKQQLLTLALFHLVVMLLAALRLGLILYALPGDNLYSAGAIVAAVTVSRIAGVASMLPMGLGSRDAGLVACLVWIGVPLPVGVAAAAIDRIVMTLPYLAGGLLGLSMQKRFTPPRPPVSRD